MMKLNGSCLQIFKTHNTPNLQKCPDTNQRGLTFSYIVSMYLDTIGIGDEPKKPNPGLTRHQDTVVVKL